MDHSIIRFEWKMGIYNMIKEKLGLNVTNYIWVSRPLCVMWDWGAAPENLFISSFLRLTLGELWSTSCWPFLFQPGKGGFTLFLRSYVKFSLRLGFFFFLFWPIFYNSMWKPLKWISMVMDGKLFHIFMLLVWMDENMQQKKNLINIKCANICRSVCE